MKLIYKETGKEVAVGDVVELRDGKWKVTYFREPHKASSSGKVSVQHTENNWRAEYFVGVIGAEWIEREDRA